MRKIYIALLAVMMAVSVAACGKSNDTTGQYTEETNEAVQESVLGHEPHG